MLKNSKVHISGLNAKLGVVESLLSKGSFKQALAEIRELENLRAAEDFSAEAGELAYLGARALRKLGKLKEALAKARKAYEILRKTEKHARLAQIQHVMGIIHAQLGEFKEAEIQLTDTASIYRRIKDEKGLADVYNDLARIAFFRSDYGRATEYINDALDFCRRTKDRQLAARLHGNLGTIMMLQDRWAEAEKSLLASLEANQALKESINACRSLLSLGNLSISARRLEEARKYLGRALDLITENSFLRELAIYHEYAGSLELARGNSKGARDHFCEAIKIGEQTAPKSAIMSQAYRLLADQQAEEGDYQEALASCEKSLQVSRDIGEKIEEAVVYRILGRVYGQDGGQAAEVREKFERGAQMMEEMGVKYELTKTYLDMSRCDVFDFREKMKFLGKAEDLASQLDSPYYLAKVHLGFAELFIRNEKPAAARDFLSRARGVLEQLEENDDLKALSALEKKIEAPRPASQLTCRDSSEGLSFDHIITRDRTTLDILKNVEQIKDLDVTILLEGDTGTGKDLLAKAIHCNSNRRDKRFVVANCAAFPESLFESELFGHKKGAFTGAVADKKGLLHEADGGTLYLDEIAEVPLPTQVKLLRAIEEKEIMRIGVLKPRKVDFRVIAATNRNLDQMVQEGKFRNDLFYRLDVMRFRLPPLRERSQDIALLVEHFLRKYSLNGMRADSAADEGLSPSEIPSLDPRILELFSVYDWPGNVRQLENEVKKLLIASRGEKMIRFDHLDNNLEKFKNGKTDSPSEPSSLPEQQEEYEREQIERALAETNGIKTQAARLLGIDEARLRYKIKKHGINIPRQEA
ncbi:MAG: sigma 54-interacting transcriptional regulator [Candidatus Zixiibacteriota bacterium]|nr:MAG: sigma 54-interacting transcriptional regulator [candidate division Zixibacteria bacterium]